MGINRRQFISSATCAAMGSTTFLSSLLDLKVANSLIKMNTATIGDYKALVCILFAGGKDSYNMLVPRDNVSYNEYKKTRSTIALEQDSLLTLENFTDRNGKQFGLHPSMSEVQNLFNEQKLAFVSNVGTLIEPTTKYKYKNNLVSKPVKLFSHADQIQQWQTSIPQVRTHRGWGGRMSDILQASNGNQNVSMNISVSGTNVFQVGHKTSEYAIRASLGGSIGIAAFDKSNPTTLEKILQEGGESILNQEYKDIFKRTYADKIQNAQDLHIEFSSALKQAHNFTTEFNSGFGFAKNMEMLAKTISVNKQLGMKRQTFFVTFGGWDHHANLIASQESRLKAVSQGLGQFQAAMEELGLSENVTTFTISDFARTLTSNGNNGSDHAWGGNVMVMGGSVKGGKVYGEYPSLTQGSNVDLGRGRLLPTLSTDEYFAELAKWYGVQNGDLEYVLPNIKNFYNPYTTSMPIGFMKTV